MKERKSFLKNKSNRWIIVEQLISQDGTQLLTWSQLQKLRGFSGCGKKPVWFQRIEELLIHNTITREVKSQFRLVCGNSLATQPTLIPVSGDKRKLEWVLFGTSRDKTEIGRIKRKKGEVMEIEHWTNGKENNEFLVKCAGCQIDEENNNEMCIIRKKFRESRRAL
jgi:hypothetical protein